MGEATEEDVASLFLDSQKNFDQFPGEVSCCHKMENLPIIRT